MSADVREEDSISDIAGGGVACGRESFGVFSAEAGLEDSTVERDIQNAAAMIRSGELVAFPTETVYGLGANAYNDKAVAMIFETKGRPQFNPLIVHTFAIAEAEKTVHFNEKALKLAKKFWPGPLTLVLPRKDKRISYLVSAGLETLGIRFPSHSVARRFLEKVGVPVAAPSANVSGTISPTTAQHVRDSFKTEKLFILEGKKSQVGLESTILDLSAEKPVLLRAGFITPDEIARELDEEVIIFDGNPSKPHSPGQLLSHYAPSLPVRINASEKIGREAFLAFGEGYPDADMNLSEKGDLREAAANLFDYLHILDNKSKYDGIAIAPIVNEGIGLAINDRIRRASYKKNEK